MKTRVALTLAAFLILFCSVGATSASSDELVTFAQATVALTADPPTLPPPLPPEP